MSEPLLLELTMEIERLNLSPSEQRALARTIAQVKSHSGKASVILLGVGIDQRSLEPVTSGINAVLHGEHDEFEVHGTTLRAVRRVDDD